MTTLWRHNTVISQYFGKRISPKHFSRNSKNDTKKDFFWPPCVGFYPFFLVLFLGLIWVFLGIFGCFWSVLGQKLLNLLDFFFKIAFLDEPNPMKQLTKRLESLLIFPYTMLIWLFFNTTQHMKIAAPAQILYLYILYILYTYINISFGKNSVKLVNHFKFG